MTYRSKARPGRCPGPAKGRGPLETHLFQCHEVQGLGPWWGLGRSPLLGFDGSSSARFSISRIASSVAPAETGPAETFGRRAWRNGRRSRLQLECPRGNPRCRTAQSRGTLPGAMPRSRSRAKPPQRAEGVETGRAAPKASGKRWRRDSPDHERRAQCRRRRKPKWYENLLSPGEVRVRAPPPAPEDEAD